MKGTHNRRGHTQRVSTRETTWTRSTPQVPHLQRSAHGRPRTVCAARDRDASHAACEPRTPTLTAEDRPPSASVTGKWEAHHPVRFSLCSRIYEIGATMAAATAIITIRRAGLLQIPPAVVVAARNHADQVIATRARRSANSAPFQRHPMRAIEGSGRALPSHRAGS